MRPRDASALPAKPQGGAVNSPKDVPKIRLPQHCPGTPADLGLFDSQDLARISNHVVIGWPDMILKTVRGRYENA